jgi:hypothetical protein
MVVEENKRDKKEHGKMKKHRPMHRLKLGKIQNRKTETDKK